MLAFADPQQSYVLHVDASLDGLGGVLYQPYPEGLRPVAFISRSLSPAERNYPAHKLEFLALKWAVVDRLHEYLYGVTFEVRTDNNPLTYLLTSAKLDAAGHRWLSALSTYSFSIKYRSGKKNVDADSLSRRPYSSETEGGKWEEIPETGVRSLCQAVASGENSSVKECPFQSFSESGEIRAPVKNVFVSATQLKDSNEELREAQGQDPYLNIILSAIMKNQSHDNVKCELPEFACWRREWSNLAVSNGLLFRVTTSEGKLNRQIVLPSALQSDTLASLHDSHGHLGFDKTYALVKDRFYWPGMKDAVKQYCKSCERCLVRKTLPRKTASMQHMQSSGPMDLVCIDFLSIEPDRHNVGNVLVVTDHFTRYAQAYPTRDQKALTVAKILCEKYFVHYGLPNRIHSDQGPDFESHLVKDVLGVLGIKKSRTTPYHPQGDPQPERFNRTLLNMLGTLEYTKKAQWSQYISQLVHAYNCSQNEATGYSPYFLMFGREPTLPVDVCYGTNEMGGSMSPSVYVQNLRKNLRIAFELATEVAKKKNLSNKRRYDEKVQECVLNPGDRVLIRNLGLRGKHKLADRWSSVVYLVDKRLENLPVYQLTPENGVGPSKVLHKDHILPVSSKVRFGEESKVVMVDDVPKKNRFPRRNLRTSHNIEVKEKGSFQVEGETDTDSESEYDCAPFRYLDFSMFDGEEIEKDKGPEMNNDVGLLTDKCLVTPQLDQGDGNSVGNLEEEAVTSDPLDVDSNTDCQGQEKEVSESVDTLPEISLRRSERERKPPARFTYPNLGIPTEERMVTTKVCGVLLNHMQTPNQCHKHDLHHNWWCNSHALCQSCWVHISTLPCVVPRV